MSIINNEDISKHIQGVSLPYGFWGNYPYTEDLNSHFMKYAEGITLLHIATQLLDTRVLCIAYTEKNNSAIQRDAYVGGSFPTIDELFEKFIIDENRIPIESHIAGSWEGVSVLQEILFEKKTAKFFFPRNNGGIIEPLIRDFIRAGRNLIA